MFTVPSPPEQNKEHSLVGHEQENETLFQDGHEPEPEGDEPPVLTERGGRALQVLLSDFERTGRSSLKQSHLNRVFEKRGLVPTEILAVMQGLLAHSVVIEDDLEEIQVGQSEGPDLDELPVGGDALGRYRRRLEQNRLLTHAEEIALGRAMRLAREVEVDGIEAPEASEIIKRGRDARRRMIVQNLRLVFSIARRYIGLSDLDMEDLIQEGTMGLMRAVEKYDHTLGYKFSTYATWWIVQSITRAIADRGRTIRLPVHVAEELWRVQRARRLLERRLGMATTEMLSEELDIPVSRIHFLLGLEQLIPTSLDTPIGGEEGSAAAVEFLTSKDPSPEERAESTQRRDLVEELVGSLSLREQEIVRGRFGFDDGEGSTLEELGRRFNLTRERIRQIEERALDRLKKRCKGSCLDDAAPPSARLILPERERNQRE